MALVPTNQAEKDRWCHRLGARFRKKCQKTSTPYICYSHFPPEKRASRKAKILPYYRGTVESSHHNQSTEAMESEEESENFSDHQENLEDNDEELVEIVEEVAIPNTADDHEFENVRKLILDYEVCRKERGGNSVRLEKDAHGIVFPRILETLKNVTGLDNPVATFTTDRCTNLTASMREFPSVVHHYDGWHYIRAIRRAIYQKMGQVQMTAIKPWIKDFVTHIYTSIESARGDGQKAYESILGFFFHATNQHANFSELTFKEKTFKFEKVFACTHEPSNNPTAHDDDSPPYLNLQIREHNKAHQVLLGILMEKNRREHIQAVSPFFTTSALESFHSVALHYLPKERFFDLHSYEMRSKLAAIHWNELQFAELSGRRRPESKIGYFCKTRKIVVEKTRKTKADNQWRREVLEQALAVEGANEEEEIQVRADVEARMYAQEL